MKAELVEKSMENYSLCIWWLGLGPLDQPSERIAGESLMVVARGWGQTLVKRYKVSSSNMSKSSRSPVQQSAYYYQYCIVYLETG